MPSMTVLAIFSMPSARSFALVVAAVMESSNFLRVAWSVLNPSETRKERMVSAATACLFPYQFVHDLTVVRLHHHRIHHELQVRQVIRSILQLLQRAQRRVRLHRYQCPVLATGEPSPLDVGLACVGAPRDVRSPFVKEPRLNTTTFTTIGSNCPMSFSSSTAAIFPPGNHSGTQVPGAVSTFTEHSVISTTASASASFMLAKACASGSISSAIRSRSSPNMSSRRCHSCTSNGASGGSSGAIFRERCSCCSALSFSQRKRRALSSNSIYCYPEVESFYEVGYVPNTVSIMPASSSHSISPASLA